MLVSLACLRPCVSKSPNLEAERASAALASEVRVTVHFTVVQRPRPRRARRLNEF